LICFGFVVINQGNTDILGIGKYKYSGIGLFTRYKGTRRWSWLYPSNFDIRRKEMV